MKTKEQAEKYFPNLRTLRPLHGGDISATYLLENAQGEKRVLKLHPSSHETPPKEYAELFIREAEGLSAFDELGILSVPHIFSFDKSHLLMSYLPPAPSHAGFWKKLGFQLARTHQKTSSSFFGFQHSNFIGRNPQKNIPFDNDGDRAWADFFMQYRLDIQMNWISKPSPKNQSSTIQSLQETYQKKRHLLWEILQKAQKKEQFLPSLLHGDLWSGNVLFCSKDNLAYVIDPAVYYGHGETDLAMTKLFGTFPSAFYEAYHSVQPLTLGWEQREKIYQLYHLLNHLHLFGESYLSPCLSLLKSIQ